ncbi:HAUS augmin-like complex subunit 7 [Chanos chanos]|uniref:HAUS augmin-like complex subunit 7 n=1 Tax=Chanos chanos TaxID=29144 RepID=A0A6J2UV65_CHACN|nr:HAUS augmin-like complex subunit 7 [Chanos chanos]
MAGISKEHQLSRDVYNTLQRLNCPLVEGLYLREAESMQELLCTPSVHRTDILKWTCVSICPSLRMKFSTLKSAEMDKINQEIVCLGYEMMICKADDLELVKGYVTPLQQLLFWGELLSLIPPPPPTEKSENNTSSSSGKELCAGAAMGMNAEFLRELISQEHLSDLHQLLTPTSKCLKRTQCAQNNTAAVRSQNMQRHRTTKPKGSFNKSHQSSTQTPLCDDDPADATALLHATQSAIEKLHKECEFMQANASGPGAAVLSPCALRVAISDLSQLMSAFRQVYNTDFKGYCQRSPPALSPNAHIFQNVHQLLHTCNMELQALQQLSDTSTSLTEAVKHVQADRRYWASGEKHTLPYCLEELINRYTAFLSLHQS